MSLSVPSEQTHLTHPKYRADIDGLRAIAVLSVVGFHASPYWIKGGFIGVDIFFVISGYLISSIIFSSLNKGTFSFSEFYARRIKRIFPALILVLSASFAFGWFALLPDEYKQLGKHIASGSGFMSNFFFWQEAGYFDNAAETKPLLHLWSLGIEEQFYIIWPLLLYFAWKWRINFLILAISVVVISFSTNISIHLSDRVQDFYSPLTRFWELMMGSILAYFTLQKIDLWGKAAQFIRTTFGITSTLAKPAEISLKNAQSLVGALLIGMAVLLVTKDRLFPGWWALLPTVGAYLIISAGQHAWLNRTVLSHRVLVWFGLISYPLYLWHWPLLSFVRILEGETVSLAIRIFTILASIFLSWMTYKFIEKPFRFGKFSKVKSYSLIFLMVIVGFMGFNSFKSGGFGFRLPKVMQELTQFSPDKGIVIIGGPCFLNPEQNYSDFKSCKSSTDKVIKKSILLWGDSNAAHLYPGYKASFGKEFNIIGRTASSCAPILNVEVKERHHCKEINDFVFEFIKKERPSKIVLAALWTAHDWRRIEETVTRLQEIGISNIDLIGPVPQWNGSLSRQIYLNYQISEPHQIPYRMKFGLSKNALLLDPLLNDFSKKLGVNYISPIKIMCNESGCLTRFGESNDTLTTRDNEHLTKMASLFLVSKFPGNKSSTNSNP